MPQNSHHANSIFLILSYTVRKGTICNMERPQTKHFGIIKFYHLHHECKYDLTTLNIIHQRYIQKYIFVIGLGSRSGQTKGNQLTFTIKNVVDLNTP